MFSALTNAPTSNRVLEFPDTMSTTHPQTIPYFVLRLSDGRAKVLFTVPSALAQSLTVNPVLCRGASFDLEIDRVSLGLNLFQVNCTLLRDNI